MSALTDAATASFRNQPSHRLAHVSGVERHQTGQGEPLYQPRHAAAICTVQESNPQLSRRIGFLRAWKNLLAMRGYRMVGHELAPLGLEHKN